MVRESLIEMQSAGRGYALTGSPFFRDDFKAAKRRVVRALAAIDGAATDPQMARQVARIRQRYDDWLRYLPLTSPSGVALGPQGLSISMADEQRLEATLAAVGQASAAQSDVRETLIARAESTVRLEILLAATGALLAAIAVGFAVRRALLLVRIEQEAEDERRQAVQARARADELERENEQIAAADRLKGEFVANMSHELRTPLTAMLGFGEVLLDGKAGPINAEQAEYLDHIITSGRHLLRLINDVLDLAKVEAGKLEAFPERVDPRASVRQVVDDLAELAADSGIGVFVDFEDAPASVVVDTLRLRQVLYNYLSNAIKFTRRGGRVTVRLRREPDGGFRVEVEDTGIGIAPEVLPELFSRFHQVNAGSDKRYPGTGLGLFLTKRVVEAHGGRVGVTSRPGRGGSFYATFPPAKPAVVAIAV